MMADQDFKIGDRVEWCGVEWVGKNYYEAFANERSACHPGNLKHKGVA